MTDVRAPEKASRVEEIVTFECDLPDAPEKVWRALTVRELVAAWLMPNDLRPEEGANFTFKGKPGEGGDVECEVLAVEPEWLIRYSWRDEDARRQSIDSIVTFELERSADGGTHLRVVHSGFQQASQKMPKVISAANSNQPLMMRCAA
jgi:uncharacterized protein YndB with AHSA1/START domain